MKLHEHTEQQSFVDSVECNLTGLHAVSIGDSEPSFSWMPCDSCGSRLGGDRFDAVALDDDKEIYELSICVDCAMYHANGELPETWCES